jgi:hypothetical protein
MSDISELERRPLLRRPESIEYELGFRPKASRYLSSNSLSMSSLLSSSSSPSTLGQPVISFILLLLHAYRRVSYKSQKGYDVETIVPLMRLNLVLHCGHA